MNYSKAFLFSVMILAGMTSRAQDTPRIVFPSVNYGFPGSGLPQVDTPAVWFLVVDTAATLTIYTIDGESFNYNPISFMIPGYIAEVKRGDQWNESFWMEPVAYLDKWKQKLNPNYVIWDSKPRK